MGKVIYPLGPGKTLWLHAKLDKGDTGDIRYGLDIPVPLLDYVTLFQRDSGRQWKLQRAGDRLPVASWFRRAPYPSFDLSECARAPCDFYLQIRHSDPIGFDLRVGPSEDLALQRQLGYLELGLILGGLILLMMWCIFQAVIFADFSYAWYALYTGAMILTRTTISGVATSLLWPDSPTWADAAQGAVPIFLAGVTLLFLRHLCGIATRNPRLGRLALLAGLCVVLMGLSYTWIDSQWQSHFVSISLAGSAFLSLLMATLTWRRKDPVGGWIILAYAPLALAVVVSLLRLNGWIAASALTFNSVEWALAASVPMLLFALNERSRFRHGILVRINKLTEQDALTGLLAFTAFEKSLAQTVKDAIMRRRYAAVVLMDLANFADIRSRYGDGIAEQSLLKSVVKLQKAAQESDPIARVGTALFAFIVESPQSRSAVQERMVQLIASGLRSPWGTQLEIPLRFHVGCLMLDEKVLAPSEVIRQLKELLTAMSPRTRRPFRFLENPKII